MWSTVTQILQGVQVVTLATNLPGPLAARRLAAMGATVIKVEPPAGDRLKDIDPEWYSELTVGQTVKSVDLKTDQGQHEFSRLLEESDLLITASRVSALTRLGLSWTELHARFPRLCQIAIVGHAGLEAELPGHDLTYQAAVGLLATGAMPSTPSVDITSATIAVAEACALLLAREFNQGAGYREVVLVDTAAELAAPLQRGLTSAEGLLGGGFPGYGIYDAREGKVALAALEPHFWSRLLDGLSVDGSRAQLEDVFLSKSAAEWDLWARERDIPLAEIAEIRSLSSVGEDL